MRQFFFFVFSPFQVNNAGWGDGKRLMETTVEGLEAMLNIHVKAVFTITQRALPSIMENKGENSTKVTVYAKSIILKPRRVSLHIFLFLLLSGSVINVSSTMSLMPVRIQFLWRICILANKSFFLLLFIYFKHLYKDTSVCYFNAQ